MLGEKGLKPLFLRECVLSTYDVRAMWDLRRRDYNTSVLPQLSTWFVALPGFEGNFLLQRVFPPLSGSSLLLHRVYQQCQKVP
jgi:hypothetical protein